VSKALEPSKAACRICQEPILNRVWELKPCVYGDLFTSDQDVALKIESHSLCLSTCSSCGLLQLDQLTDLKMQYDDYLNHTKITFGLSEFYKNLAQKLTNEVHGRIRTALDIGSNDGSFLRELKNNGFSVLGIEPADKPSKAANESGIRTIRRYFDYQLALELHRDFGEFELITMNYALANVPNLQEIFRGVERLLAEKGIFSVVTGYHPDQFSVNMFDYVGHDHLTYLTIRDLKFIGERHGLNIFAVERVEHKGGSVVVHFCRKDSGIKKSNSVHQLLQREDWQQVDSTKFILDLKSRVDEQKNLLLNYLKENRIENLLGIGASISTTYLANYLGVSDRLAYLFDDDSNKWNCFSPGSGTRVLPMSEVSQQNNKFAILLAWQHTNRILERLRDSNFLGTLLIPLPYFRTLNFSQASSKFN